jgi:hypothetical protein
MSDILKNFNEILSEFILKMIATFPDEKKLRTYYRAFTISKGYNIQMPLQLFMGGCMSFEEQIKARDANFFLNRPTFVNKMVNCSSSFSDDTGIKNHWINLNDNTKNSIWEYIQTLYVMGELYINKNSDLINKIAEVYDNMSATELKRFESETVDTFSTDFIQKIK